MYISYTIYISIQHYRETAGMRVSKRRRERTINEQEVEKNQLLFQFTNYIFVSYSCNVLSSATDSNSIMQYYTIHKMLPDYFVINVRQRTRTHIIHNTKRQHTEYTLHITNQYYIQISILQFTLCTFSSSGIKIAFVGIERNGGQTNMI